MILFIVMGIVLKLKEDNFFNGIGKEVIVSKEGVYSGYKIKKLKEIKGRKLFGYFFDWYLVDGKLYYKDKIVFEKEELLNIARFKDYILCSTIPSNIIYIFKDGKLKDSINIDIDNISGIQVLDNDIFLFTGGDGKVFKMDLKGNLKEFITLPVSNVLGIYKEKNKMYFYTYNPGRVYEYENGKVRIYYDPNITEINGFFINNDTIYISGNKEIGGNIEGYVIFIFGGMEKIVYKGTPIISSCLTDLGFLCGENQDGQIGLFTKNGFKIIADLEEKEILSIIKENGKIIILTGEDANIYEITKELSSDGFYETEVIDGGYGVRWGKINYKGSGVYKISYKTGMTNKVDSSWKDWEEYKGMINSTDRYLKLKFQFSSKNDSLYEININYASKNRAPEIVKFTVFPQGIGFGQDQNFTGGQLIQMNETKKLRDKGFDIPDGAYNVSNNLRCIYWDITDEDNDPLYVRLYIKEGKRWRILRENPLGNAFFINTYEFPEGIYRIRIVVYDAKDSAFKEISFLNDLSAPELKSYEIKNNIFYGLAYDKLSEIYEISYKFDDDDFYKYAEIEDGVCDDKEERFFFPLGEDKKGLSIRIEDIYGNIKTIPIILK